MSGGITDPAEYYFKDGLWTYDGTVWRPQSQLISYRDRVVVSDSETSVGAGVTVWGSGAVPTGYVFDVQFISAYHDDTSVRNMQIQLNGGGAACVLIQALSVAAGVLIVANPHAILKAGDYVQILCTALASGKHLYGAIWGYEFKVNE